MIYNGSPPFFPMTTLVSMTSHIPNDTYESLRDKEEASSQVRVAFDSINKDTPSQFNIQETLHALNSFWQLTASCLRFLMHDCLIFIGDLLTLFVIFSLALNIIKEICPVRCTGMNSV